MFTYSSMKPYALLFAVTCPYHIFIISYSIFRISVDSNNKAIGRKQYWLVLTTCQSECKKIQLTVRITDRITRKYADTRDPQLFGKQDKS